MRRATKAAPIEMQQLASVLVDAIELDKREEVRADLNIYVPIAMAQYLRSFPTARIVNNRLWTVKHNVETQENDFLCIFCRESLNTLPWRQNIKAKMAAGFVKHAEKCAMYFLAGMIAGVGPRGEAPKKFKPPKPPKVPKKPKVPEPEYDGVWFSSSSGVVK